MNLVGGAQACNIIFLAFGLISFTGTVPPVINGIFIGGTSVTFSNSPVFAGAIYAQTGNVTFDGAAPVGGPVLNGCVIICYAEGTKILTKRGQVAVEDLRAGDIAVSYGTIERNHVRGARTTYKPITWVSKFKVRNLNAESMPICIKAGALGENKPFEDLYVSPNHALMINSSMVAAKRLVNGTTIVQEYGQDSVTYYHVELPAHSVIIANGVAAESYLETGNRYVFEKSEKIHVKKAFSSKVFPMCRD
jgi:hypothetical protein